MPNTLIHLAVQSAASAPWMRGTRSRAGSSTSARGTWSWPLILLGAVLPDAPWIVQRVLRTALLQSGVASTPAGDPIFYDLRLFAGLQSSLLFCLLLSAACAAPCRRPRRAFAILSFGALIHLLLDATQIKWANGVLLLIPFDWRLLRFDWLWPEHPAVPWISLVSLAAVVIMAWRLPSPDEPLLHRPTARPHRWLLAAVAAAGYALLPFLWVAPLEASGAYSVDALRHEQIAVPVELGTAWVFFENREGETGQTLAVRTLSERQLPIQAPAELRLAPGRWSLRGTLMKTEEGVALQVSQAHRHQRRVRESFSILGLLLVTAVWLRAARRLC